MDIEKLKTFCLAAQEPSIRKAAKKAGKKYTTFRKKLLTLESELNIPLFHHALGKILLTKQGQDFLQHAKNIVTYSENQLSLFHQKEENLEGNIKIGTTNAIAALWIVDAITKFTKLFPKMQITIVGNDTEINLYTREADVLIRTFTSPNEDLIELLLTEYHMNLYASEEYVNLYGLPKNAIDLKNHRIIGYGENCPYPYPEINWHLKLLPDNFHPQFNINSGGAILKAVENGIGIGSISQKGVEVSKNKLIRVLENEITGPTIKVSFCYPKNTEMTKSIQILYDYLRNQFS